MHTCNALWLSNRTYCGQPYSTLQGRVASSRTHPSQGITRLSQGLLSFSYTSHYHKNEVVTRAGEKKRKAVSLIEQDSKVSLRDSERRPLSRRGKICKLITGR